MRGLTPERAERVLAEAVDAGATGAEERDAPARRSPRGTELVLYAPDERAEAVRRAVQAVAGAGARVGDVEPVPEVDWSQAWKRGLAAVEVSPRLVVRPPFVPFALAPGQREVVIDPGQAFGTGGHASTRLALALLDAERARLGPASRVLDVGTGSGVLALAAVVLGAGRAVALDLDPLAARAARAAAGANGCSERLAVFAGPLAALAGARFDLVLANLLKRELLPVVPGIATRLARGGCAVISGLLAAEHGEVEAALGGAGLRVARTLEERDATGDHWLGLTATPSR